MPICTLSKTKKPTKQKKIIIPAEVWDYLAMSSEAYGGIGAYRTNDEHGNPCCVFGHAVVHVAPELERSRKYCDILWHAGIHPANSDDAVDDINRRKHKNLWNRVSFEEWCIELNVVRGK